MHKQLTTQERLIQFFVNEFKNSKTHEVSISKSDLSNINLSEEAAARNILLIQEGGLLKIKHNSVHNDFSMSWKVALNPNCVYYFENKQERQKQNRNYWIQFWIPVSLSAIAIIISIVALVLVI